MATVSATIRLSRSRHHGSPFKKNLPDNLISPNFMSGKVTFSSRWMAGTSLNSLDFSDISRTAFPELKDITSPPQPHFADKNFYKIILKDEGEISAKIHKLLRTLINTQDPETRSNARLRLIPAYWDLISKVIRKTPRLEPLAKRLCMRYGSPAAVFDFR
jgi:hypothetical protein